MPNDKRLIMLESLTAAEGADPFAWYGLALEYRGRGRIDDALRTFVTLRQDHPTYVAMYLMCGTMLHEADRSDEAREWLESGVLAARDANNTHALSELNEALEQLPAPRSIS